MDKVYLLRNRDFNEYDSWWLVWGAYATEALARTAALAIWDKGDEGLEFIIEEVGVNQ